MSEINKHNSLLSELRQIIGKGKLQVAVQVNSALTLTYWHLGKRINQDVLQNKRAEYGKPIVSTVSTQLVQEYGKSFEARNLRRMMRFVEEFPEIEIVTSLMTQLSWTHFLQLFGLKTREIIVNPVTYRLKLKLNIKKNG